MERLKQRLQTAEQALSTLKEIPVPAPDTLTRDAGILRFQYTLEASWKLAQLYLRTSEAIEVGSPKSVIRACLQAGLLDAQQTSNALDMMNSRNLAVHTYNEMLANQLFSQLPAYTKLLETLLLSIKQKINELG